jgi:hypothetical protein
MFSMEDIVEQALQQLEEDVTSSEITETDSFEDARKTVRIKHKIIEELTLDENSELVDVATLEQRLNDCNLEVINGQVCGAGNGHMTYGIGQEAYDLVSQNKHPFAWLKPIDSETEEMMLSSVGVRSIRK